MLFEQLKNLHLKNNFGLITELSFIEWFVGFVDGDAGFSIGYNKQDNLYKNNFYITQSYYNLRTLQYIQHTLSVGHISYTTSDGTRYQVQNVTELIDVIVPILDYYPLFTWRYARYLIFRESLMVRNASFLQDKIRLMELKHQLNSTMTDPFYDSYIAPTFDIKKPTKSWIVGFV